MVLNIMVPAGRSRLCRDLCRVDGATAMGMDLHIGMKDSFYAFPKRLQELLQVHNLELPEERFCDYVDESDRGYPFRYIGELVRKEQLPYPHLSRITCSIHEVIVPIDFPDPIPIFGHKSDDEMKQMFDEEFLKDPNPVDEDIHHYAGESHYTQRIWYQFYTNPYDVHMLSSHQLLKEISSYLDRTLPSWQPDDDWWSDNWDDLEDRDWWAKNVFRCCRYAVASRKIMWFVG